MCVGFHGHCQWCIGFWVLRRVLVVSEFQRFDPLLGSSSGSEMKKQVYRFRRVTLQEWDEKTTYRFRRATDSAVAEHFIDTGHTFSFQPKVLAKTKGKYARLVREAIEIYKLPNNINRDDGLRLKAAWLPTLHTKRHSSATRDDAWLNDMRRSDARARSGALYFDSLVPFWHISF